MNLLVAISRTAFHLENRLYHLKGKRIPNPYVEDRFVRCFQTSQGTFFIPDDAVDDAIARCIRKGRMFDKAVVAVIGSYLQTGATVLDIGSNYGQMAIDFARMVGDGGRVYAFEASREVFSILKLNIEANGLRNITARRCAVYERSGDQLRYADPDAVERITRGSHGLDPNASAGEPVTTIAIDDLDLPAKIDFMKIDIQGSDLFALRGARKTIAKHRMPIIFEYEEGFQHRFGTSFHDYVEFVREIGYRFERTIDYTNYLIVPQPLS